MNGEIPSYFNIFKSSPSKVIVVGDVVPPFLLWFTVSSSYPCRAITLHITLQKLRQIFAVDLRDTLGSIYFDKKFNAISLNSMCKTSVSSVSYNTAWFSLSAPPECLSSIKQKCTLHAK